MTPPLLCSPPLDHRHLAAAGPVPLAGQLPVAQCCLACPLVSGSCRTMISALVYGEVLWHHAKAPPPICDACLELGRKAATFKPVAEKDSQAANASKKAKAKDTSAAPGDASSQGGSQAGTRGTGRGGARGGAAARAPAPILSG